MTENIFREFPENIYRGAVGNISRTFPGNVDVGEFTLARGAGNRPDGTHL
ncbi:hypothetical protein [Nocardia carnea]|nr:hypothetical protein [Nocardia carnea]